MGLLSIFQRKKQTSAKPAKPGRAGKAAARQAPLANSFNTANPAESAEAVREARARARRRLMGATVLLLVGVIGFPLLFERQPRPIPVDLPIEIPPRNGAGGVDASGAHVDRSGAAAAAGLSSGVAAAASATATPESVSYDARSSSESAPAVPVASAPSGGSRSAFASLAAALTPGAHHSSEAFAGVAPIASAPVPAASVAQERAYVAPLHNPARPIVRAELPPASAARAPLAATIARPSAPLHADIPKPTLPTPPTATALAPANASNSGAAAAALLAGTSPKPSDAAPATARFVVQVGAFADDAKVREARGKVEKTGVKSYTQAVETPGGKRIRVRVGPYATKAEADKVAARIKAGGLPAAVLAL